MLKLRCLSPVQRKATGHDDPRGLYQLQGQPQRETAPPPVHPKPEAPNVAGVLTGPLPVMKGWSAGRLRPWLCLPGGRHLTHDELEVRRERELSEVTELQLAGSQVPSSRPRASGWTVVPPIFPDPAPSCPCPNSGPFISHQDRCLVLLPHAGWSTHTISRLRPEDLAKPWV